MKKQTSGYVNLGWCVGDLISRLKDFDSKAEIHFVNRYGDDCLKIGEPGVEASKEFTKGLESRMTKAKKCL